MDSSLMDTLDELDNFTHDHFDYGDYYSTPSDAMDDIYIMYTMILIIIIIIIVIGLIGNISVVLISVFYMRLRSLIAIFMFNLALSDLLNTIRAMFWLFYCIWNSDFWHVACKVHSFVYSTGFFSSVGLLALISVQRYMVVARRLSGCKKGSRFTICLICVWLLSVLAALPVTVDTEAHFMSCLVRSKALQHALTYTQSIVFVCTFLMAGFCYIRILQTIKSTTNQTHKTTGLTFCLVATFFICWAPVNIMLLYTTMSHHSHLNHFFIADLICNVLACSHCCYNPVIYGIFFLKFRETAKEIFGRQAASNCVEMRNEECHDDEGCESLSN